MITLNEYRLPFIKPFVTAAGTFNHRNGILIHYKDFNHNTIVEASPLPGFSAETTKEVRQLLIDNSEEIDTFFKSDFDKFGLNDFLETIPNLSSLQFALSWMGIELLRKRNDDSFSSLFQTPQVNNIIVNATIGISDVEGTLNEIDKLSKVGFKTFKIKTSASVDNLISILEASTSRNSGITFRIDANQSWSKNRLPEILKSLEPYSIEYIEEPVAFSSAEEVKKYSGLSPIQFALDESLNKTIPIESALKHLPETVLIIKPMMMGNFLNLFETITRYRSLVNNIVVTTSLESVVGRSMIVNSATIIGDKTKAHGLNTGSLFQHDLTQDELMTVNSGSMNVLKPISFSDLEKDLIVPIGTYSNE